MGTLNAQSASLESGHWTASAGGGFLVPHRSVIRGLIDGHAQRVEVSWSNKGYGYWAATRTQPRWGVSLSITDAGSSQHIGTQIAAVSHVDLALRGRLHFRLGGGLGWTQKPWDARTRQGRERVVLGSAINGAAQIGLGFLSSLNPVLWHEHVGLHLRLDHQSNASFTQPNLGTNVVSLSVSTHLRKKPSLFRASDGDYVDILPAPIHGGYVFLGVGQRQPSPLSAREDVLECGYEYRLGQQSRIGYITGALLMLRPGHWGSSLHAGFQLRFSRVYIDLIHGRYVQRWQSEENQYNRVVLNVHLHQGLWSRLVLHTHGFRAHHPSIGIAWVPRNQAPFAALK